MNISFYYSVLDFDNFNQLIEYEQAFFQAFVKLDNPLLHKIWAWDYEKKRIKNLIPYEDQIVYLCHDQDNNLLGAMSVNLNQELNQFSQFGFKIESTNHKFAEIMVMFKHPEYRSPWWKFYNKFIKYAYKHLQQYEVKEIYTNCGTERLLKTYQRGSWQLIDTKFIWQDVRYFLKLNLLAPETVHLFQEIKL